MRTECPICGYIYTIDHAVCAPCLKNKEAYEHELYEDIDQWLVKNSVCYCDYCHIIPTADGDICDRCADEMVEYLEEQELNYQYSRQANS